MASRTRTRDVARAVRPMRDPLEDSYISRRQATVTGTWGTTVTITFAGDATEIHGVHYLASYSPTVSDVVWVDIKGGDLLIIGKQA